MLVPRLIRLVRNVMIASLAVTGSTALSADPAKPAAAKPAADKPAADKSAAAAKAKTATKPATGADPFDGRSLAGWTTQDGKPVETGWEVVDGVIHLKKDGKRAGNIITADEFGDFDLSFEWKIAPKGNSGIKYRVRSYGGKVLGCEYQIYDDVGAKTSPKSKNGSGALYDLYEPNDDKHLKPAGEYNTGRIVVRGQHVEHWLNGKRIVSAEIGDREWKRRIAASKFNGARDFALQPGGRLMLTDHGSEVWYRNVTFTASPPPPKPKLEAVKETFVYKQVGELDIKADVEVAKLADDPARTDEESPGRPVIVWIHGGGLINGHRESVPGWVRETFLPRGYAVVSIDYRLAPETKLLDIVEDVEDALVWVRTVGKTAFGADPKRVAVAGGSAGGCLTLIAGLRSDPRPQCLVSLWGYGDLGAPWTCEASDAPRHAAGKIDPADVSKLLAGPPVSDSRERTTADAAAYYQTVRREGTWAEAVSGWDPTTRPARFLPFMPERAAGPEYPPTLLIHGDADTDVPFDSSARMAARLKKQNVEHRLIRFAEAEHGLAGADPQKVAEAYDAAADFVIRHLEE